MKAVSKELKDKEKQDFDSLKEHFMPYLQEALNNNTNTITPNENLNLPDTLSSVNNPHKFIYEA